VSVEPVFYRLMPVHVTPFCHCQFYSGVTYGTGNNVQWNYLV
jgi:hypothetical protein